MLKSIGCSKTCNRASSSTSNRRVGDTEYVFKHALTQEVAYNALLVEQRKLLHERAGEVLESMFAGQLDDHLYELARQYSRSDNLTKAVEYLGRAGQLATQHSAAHRRDQPSELRCGTAAALASHAGTGPIGTRTAYRACASVDGYEGLGSAGDGESVRPRL